MRTWIERQLHGTTRVAGIHRLVAIELVAHIEKVVVLAREHLLPKRHDPLHGPRVVLVVNKNCVKVKRVGLFGYASNGNDRARARGSSVQLECERCHSVHDLLRSGQFASSLKPNALHTAHRVVILGEATHDTKRGFLVDVRVGYANEQSQVVHRSGAHCIPLYAELGLVRNVSLVPWKHAEMDRSLAQVGGLAFEALVEGAGHLSIALILCDCFARCAAVDANAADPAPTLGTRVAILTNRGRRRHVPNG